MTDSKRCEINKWLEDRFGYRNDIYFIPTTGMYYASKETMAVIRNVT
jgi:sporulation-control protein spo0M